jgi:hypothetical protein
MDRKSEFIAKLEQLINSCDDVLKSKGKPIKILEKNKMNACTSEESLSLLVATDEEKREFYERRKELFTKTVETIDFDKSRNLTIQVLNCLICELGENNYIVKNILNIYNLKNIDKENVNKIKIILSGIIISAENNDIPKKQENYDMVKNISFTEVHGNANIQHQLGTDKSTQNMYVDGNIDYEKVLKLLKDILENIEALNLSKDDKENLKIAVAEARPLAETKSNDGMIKKSLNVIKDIMLRVSSSVIAQGILYSLQGIGIM